MVINLVGKFSNLWGCEHMIQRGFEALGHTVHPFEINHSYAILRSIQVGGLTVVLQGYGLAPKLIESMRRLTKKPVVLWHAEVMSPSWPTDDEVVLAKAEQLKLIAGSFDAVGHNCHTALDTVRTLGGRNVFWSPNNGVDSQVHRRIDSIKKKYAIGSYGYLSPRRVELLRWLYSEGIKVEYRRPEDKCFGEELIRFINSCFCVINFHFSETKNTESRTYEVLGCGVPLLSEPLSMPEIFPFTECGIGTFHDTDSLLELSKNIVRLTNENPSYLEKIGSDAMRFVHSNYSYVQRCKFFLEQVSERFPCKIS